MAHILVVDDEDQIRGLLKEALTRRGHSVSEAASGEEALSALRGGSVDVMLLDVMMPGMGGVETIMKAQQELQDVRTVIMSGRIDTDSEAFQRIAKQFGAAGVLAKPFELQELFVLVDSLAG